MFTIFFIITGNNKDFRITMIARTISNTLWNRNIVIFMYNLLGYCPLILYINYTVRNVHFRFSQLKLDNS